VSPFLEKAQYIKNEHYSNFCTFEIASLVNVPGHYLTKYSILAKIIVILDFPKASCTLEAMFLILCHHFFLQA
jgi:hypothetical protein